MICYPCETKSTLSEEVFMKFFRKNITTVNLWFSVIFILLLSASNAFDNGGFSVAWLSLYILFLPVCIFVFFLNVDACNKKSQGNKREEKTE